MLVKSVHRLINYSLSKMIIPVAKIANIILSRLLHSDQYHRIIYIPIIFIYFVHAYSFTAGFRITPDDVLFHYFAMDNFDNAFGFISDTAARQGRIGHYIDLPILMFSSYYSEHFLYRALFVSIFFLKYFLFAYYIQSLTKTQIGGIVLLFAIIIYPVDYLHMLPTSYPLKSISISSIIIIRILLLKIYIRNKLNGWEIFISGILLLSMIVNEYATLYAISIIMGEYTIRIMRAYSIERSIIESIYIYRRQLVRDFIIITFALMAYIGFRNLNPSLYEGNLISSDIEFSLLLKTLFGHIFGGTIFTAYLRSNVEIYNMIGSISILKWVLYSFTAIIVSVYTYKFFVVGSSRKQNVVSVLLVLILAIITLSVTLPVAAINKYQLWCADIKIIECVYLDSSYASLTVAAIVIVFIYQIIRNTNAGKKIVLMVALVFGLISFSTNIHNAVKYNDMKRYVYGWGRAQQIACSYIDLKQMYKDLDNLDLKLPDVVENINKRINYHTNYPNFDMEKYWIRYIENRHNNSDCEEIANTNYGLYPIIKPDEELYVRAGGSAVPYLVSGWANMESWGIWSDGDEVRVILPATFRIDELVLDLSPFLVIERDVKRQELDVRINGIEYGEIYLSNPGAEQVRIKLSNEASSKALEIGYLDLEIGLPNAISPYDLGIGLDARKLAIGLRSIRLIQHYE